MPDVSRALARVGGGDDPGANKGAPLIVETTAAPPESVVAFDNGQGDPNADEDGVSFALNSQSHAGVAGTLRGGETGGTTHGKPSGTDRGTFVVDARGIGDGEAAALVGDHMNRVTDYTPVVFEARIARNDRGQPDEVVPPLKAESGRSGKGDGAPLLAVAPEVVGPIAPNAGPKSHDAGNFHTNQGVDAGHIIAVPDPAYAVQGVGSKFGSGRENQDTFVVQPADEQASTLRSRQHSEGVGIPGRGGEDDQNLVIGAFSDRMGETDGAKITETPPPLRSSSRTVAAFHVDGRSADVDDETAPTLQASDARLSNQVAGVVELPEEPQGVSENQRHELRLTPYLRQMTAGGGKPGQGYPAVLEGGPSQASEVTQRRTTGFVRRLTPRECERLQGFPDDWTAHGADGKKISDSARYRMLGNAVTVPVAEWIGRRLMAVHAADKERRS